MSVQETLVGGRLFHSDGRTNERERLVTDNANRDVQYKSVDGRTHTYRGGTCIRTWERRLEGKYNERLNVQGLFIELSLRLLLFLILSKFPL